jgi:diguanylate cyclase (GGDEF)-like protein
MPLVQDSTAWVVVVSALGAAVLAVVVSAIVFSVLVRGRSNASNQLERMLEVSNTRFEVMLEDLAKELERSQDETRRFRELAGIGSSIDLDAVVSRVLEAAGTLPRVDAAMIVVPRDGDAAVIATRGMSAEEAARHPVGGAPTGDDARSVTISYDYAPEHVEGNGQVIRGGLVVPLKSDTGNAVGTLAVFWRDAERKATDEQIAVLEELASTSGPAIDNARRFREARKLADLDALTHLNNRRYFHDTLAREVARAQRYDRRLALVIFDIDDFKAINERVGHLAGDAVLAQLAERVRSVVRGADIACRVGGDEFAVILPESMLTDAEQLYERVRFAVSVRPTGPADRLDLSAGIAELESQDDAVSFFERADEALFRAKETGKGHAVSAPTAS